MMFIVSVSLIIYSIKQNKPIKVKSENLSLISSIILRKLRPRQKKMVFLKKMCSYSFFCKLPSILSRVLLYTEHFGLEE